MKQFRILLVAFLMIMGSSIYAQTGLKLDTESSKVTVLGTSTLHDWEMDAEQVSGDLQLDGDQIQSLNFNCVVEGIKSGKSKMDNLAYEALKSDDSPNITFDLTSVEGDVLNGNLEIAGKTVPVSIKLEKTIENETVKLTGSYDLLMTTFGMTPPTAVFGTIKTGDDITVKFELNYKQ